MTTEASRYWPPTTPKPESSYTTAWNGPISAVSIHYMDAVPITVRGTATGRQYLFSGSAPVQSVDRRDADALLRTRYFRRA